MTIDDDYNLVGTSPLPFEDFLLRLLEFGAAQKLARVTLWDRDGEAKTTVVEPGFTGSDIKGLAAAPEAATGISCWLRLVVGGVESPLVIGGTRGDMTLVDGPAYLPHIMREAEDRALALEDLARFACGVAGALDCAYLGLSPESQTAVPLETGSPFEVFVPEVFMIVSRSQMTGSAAPAFHAAAKVEPLDDRLLVWLQSPEAFVGNRPAAPAAQHLARTLVGLSHGSARADR